MASFVPVWLHLSTEATKKTATEHHYSIATYQVINKIYNMILFKTISEDERLILLLAGNIIFLE